MSPVGQGQQALPSSSSPYTSTYPSTLRPGAQDLFEDSSDDDDRPQTLLNYAQRNIDRLERSVKRLKPFYETSEYENATEDQIDSFQTRYRCLKATLDEEKEKVATLKSVTYDNAIEWKIFQYKKLLDKVDRRSRKNMQFVIDQLEKGDALFCNLERTTCLVLFDGKLYIEVEKEAEAIKMIKENHDSLVGGSYWVEHPWNQRICRAAPMRTHTVSTAPPHINGLFTTTGGIVYRMTIGEHAVVVPAHTFLLDTGLDSQIILLRARDFADLQRMAGQRPVVGGMTIINSPNLGAEGRVQPFYYVEAYMRNSVAADEPLTNWELFKAVFEILPEDDRVINPFAWRSLYMSASPPLARDNVNPDLWTFSNMVTGARNLFGGRAGLGDANPDVDD